LADFPVMSFLLLIAVDWLDTNQLTALILIYLLEYSGLAIIILDLRLRIRGAVRFGLR
jgi:hypothetical protein